MKKLLSLFFIFAIPWGQTVEAEMVAIPPKSSARLLKQGEESFKTNCVACHGAKGDGHGPAAVAIKDPKPRDFTKGVFKYGSKPEEIFKTISQGVKETAMPSWSSLSEQDRWALSYYVISLGKK